MGPVLGLGRRGTGPVQRGYRQRHDAIARLVIAARLSPGVPAGEELGTLVRLATRPGAPGAEVTLRRIIAWLAGLIGLAVVLLLLAALLLPRVLDSQTVRTRIRAFVLNKAGRGRLPGASRPVPET